MTYDKSEKKIASHFNTKDRKPLVWLLGFFRGLLEQIKLKAVQRY